jgi:hypothetical protein
MPTPFGTTQTDNQNTPVGSVYVPNTANADLTPLEGGTASTDTLGRTSAPVAMEVKKSSVATLTNVSASITSVTILALLVTRKGMLLYNDSASALYLKYGSAASTTSFTVKILPYQLFEMPVTPVYTGILTALWDTATGTARVTELT